MAPEFESGCPLPFASGPDGDDISVAAADFVAWQARAADDARAASAGWPTVYRVWLQRPDTTDRTGRAVYFQAGDDDYAVFASLTPRLLVHKLPAGWLRGKLLPAQRQSTGYAQTVIPRLEIQVPGLALRPADDDGSIALSPRSFEELFVDSGVELEAVPFGDAFARELRELAAAAAHARTCGRPLRLHQV